MKWSLFSFLFLLALFLIQIALMLPFHWIQIPILIALGGNCLRAWRAAQARADQNEAIWGHRSKAPTYHDH